MMETPPTSTFDLPDLIFLKISSLVKDLRFSSCPLFLGWSQEQERSPPGASQQSWRLGLQTRELAGSIHPLLNELP